MINAILYKNNQTPIKHTFYGRDVYEVIEHAKENYLNDEGSYMHIKADNSDSLIKLEVIDGTAVKSYILDLFDFDKNFEQLN